MIDASAHQAAFRLLIGDLRRVLEFIEPVDANAATYSLRTYELLLRTATEFEALCRAYLVQQGYSAKAPDSFTVLDYRTLEPELHLASAEVLALFWRPAPLSLRPFKDWSSATPPLPWYSSYNAVKHNRATSFPKASLINATTALAGLFALMATTNVRSRDKWQVTTDDRYTEYAWECFAVRFPRAA